MRPLSACYRVAVTAALILATTSAPAALPVVTTVYPTGTFPLDAQNVQAAIDEGGTVVLKATGASGHPTAFNFGPPDPVVNGGVLLTTDVSVIGETVGGYQTTIQGGFNPILGLAPVKSTIKGIHFDGPLDSPIALIRSTGSTIVGNRITGIVPLPLLFGAEVEGIFVSGFDDPQNAVTGHITVADNVIEIAGGDFVNGMQFDEVSADIDIVGNTVHFLSSDGVIQSIGILVFRSHGKADIVGNIVMMDGATPDVFPSSIFVGGHEEARYRIAGNTIVDHHPNADGIDVVAFSFSGATRQAHVIDNSVELHSTAEFSGALVFQGGVQTSSMSANRAFGTGGDAVQILGIDSTLVAGSNRAVGNDILGFTPIGPDVFFGPYSTRNLFAGQCRTWQDLGEDNRIVCGGPQHSAHAAAARTTRRPGDALRTLGDQILHAKLALHGPKGR